MKKSYQKLLVFQFIIFLILLLNSITTKIVNQYSMCLFLLILLVVFKMFFGYEKDRHRYTKSISYDIIIFLLIYFIIYYLFGLIVGYAKTDNYLSIAGITKVLLPLVIIIIEKEILRYMMLRKSENNRLLIITTCLLFIFLDVATILIHTDFTSKHDSFLFFALTLLPSISTNISFSYISLKTGYKPGLIYLLVMNLYQYIIPIIPNPSEYILSIIKLICPMIVLYIAYKTLKTPKEDLIERENPILPWLIPSVITLILVYFISGYFRFQAIAIASGSMSPEIEKGDVVIIEKKIDKDKLKKGMIIAYKYNQRIIVHRLTKIEQYKDTKYYYTKGDANKSADDYFITEDMIIGIAEYKIPYIGIPTVWLNER